MILDALLSFIPVGGTLSLVAGAGIAIPSTNTIDILGSGVGTPPKNIIGNTTLFGEDSGIGHWKPEIQIGFLNNFVTANGATLNVAFQGAPDTGAAGGYLPGTWTTFVETGAMAVASLVAGGIARLDWPPAFPPNALPRYLRLLFSPPAGTNFTTGTISSAVVTMNRPDLANKYQVRNYAVA